MTCLAVSLGRLVCSLVLAELHLTLPVFMALIRQHRAMVTSIRSVISQIRAWKLD